MGQRVYQPNEVVQMDRAMLVKVWQQLLRRPPPKQISAPFMRRFIVDKLQADLHGGLDSKTRHALMKAARGSKRQTSREYEVGAKFFRDWNGVCHQVECVEGGYLYQGTVYSSLSVIARHITGAHWSGPRFFGVNKLEKISTETLP